MVEVALTSLPLLPAMILLPTRVQVRLSLYDRTPPPALAGAVLDTMVLASVSARHSCY